MIRFDHCVDQASKKSTLSKKKKLERKRDVFKLIMKC